MNNFETDSTDLRILQALQTDASTTQRDLAKKAHISPATALRRIERLKTLGVIERTVAIINPNFFPAYLQVIAEVTLDKQDITSQDQFESSVLHLDEIQQCYRVSAGPDFILILTILNMDAYQQLARTIFSTQHNVRNVRAFFSTQRSKFTTQQPLPEIKTR